MAPAPPFALVWTPIPIVTWLFPFVGHLGITRSDGVIYDFAGHCTVNVDNMAFGQPSKCLQLQPEKAAALRDQVNMSIRNGSNKTLAMVWDDWMSFSRSIYSSHAYSFFGDNCHAFVAHFLNSIRYDQPKAQSRGWSPVALAWRVFLSQTYLGGWGGWLRSWGPWAALMCLGWWLGGAAFLACWALLAAAAMAWFSVYAACCVSRNTRILSI